MGSLHARGKAVLGGPSRLLVGHSRVAGTGLPDTHGLWSDTEHVSRQALQVRIYLLRSAQSSARPKLTVLVSWNKNRCDHEVRALQLAATGAGVLLLERLYEVPGAFNGAWAGKLAMVNVFFKELSASECESLRSTTGDQNFV